MSAERIDRAAIPPTLIRFDGGCLTVLRSDLAAVAPEEGCALLLGGQAPDRSVCVQTIWPCRNVWALSDQRHRRFALDPREQIAAQRWARLRCLRVVGVAHSHPDGGQQPSELDCALADPALVTVILDRSGAPAAWWLPGGDAVVSVPVQVWDTELASGL
ncbi:MAG: M67 family metallopeptidase [Synechococcus sp.]